MPTLKPILDSDWWLIGPRPLTLDAKLPGPPLPADAKEHDACVDHHIVQSADGAWHLWACVRATRVGRVLYHWESGDLAAHPWRDTGEFLRRSESAGECLDDWKGQEWLQSPYFVRAGGKWFMFYGGHATGGTASDGIAYSDPVMPGQMCLMTSPDGRTWTRHRDNNGYSRIFVGPGEVRDPCVVRVGDEWYCYYAGFDSGDRNRPGFYCRTSRNLIHWSDWRCVHQDLKLSASPWGTECPHVVRRGGQWYMFRTENYYERKTHVLRSDDPMDFGVGDSGAHYVGTFPAAAVEIYEVNGQEYVTSSHAPMLGTHMARLKWVESD